MAKIGLRESGLRTSDSHFPNRPVGYFLKNPEIPYRITSTNNHLLNPWEDRAMKSRSYILVLIIAILILIFRFSAVDSASTVTFTKDVAPIFYSSCATCHSPGEMAPMSLLTYKEVRPWAKAIRERVLSREMPPWYADPNHGEFANDAR